MAYSADKMATQPPGGNEGVETRLTKLETRLDTILPTLATKSDVSETKAWIAATGFVITGLIITVVSIVINAKMTPPPSAPAPQSQAPVIVYPPQPISAGAPVPPSPK
jgi:hypothetical protein